MAALPSVAAIVNGANLDPKNIPQVETLFEQFTNLSPTERDNERGSFVEKVFPLFFGENAVVDGSSAYEAQRQVAWYGRQSRSCTYVNIPWPYICHRRSTACWLRPRVVVLPGSAQQVGTTVSLCRFFGIKFSIRGGGHSPSIGWSSNDGGVVISLAAFDQVNLSEDKLTADIGVGLRWLDVYKALDQYDLAVAGGRFPTVGVSGLLLGGGLSFRHGVDGIGAMGVSNYEVVLANAEIVNANAKENSDLFWALKGAGGNFGIVTKIEMKTVPAKVWSEAKLYAPSVTSELLQALMKHHEAIESDEKSSLLLTCNNPGTALVSLYCDAVNKLPVVFEPFEHIPATSQSLPRGVYSTYELLGVIETLAVPGHVCHDFRTMSSQPSLEVYETAERVRMEQGNLLSDVEGLRISNVIQPMSSISIKQSRKVGRNPLGLEEVGQQWLLAMADWNNPADGDRVRQAMRHVVDATEATAKANGTYLPSQYCNYASLDQDPLASYGAENLERLRAIASKYDPDGVFQTLQSGGWLLSRVGPTE
ncbi:6-hydroxy-D-nicotine oxidase [Aspergillus minisclerotigenes]|uniref:6-hydroxy-D-nicotine oxidase n=1 Tax=Aspergillus minisclerotigenes TaxID=656917 RepID=A0A5N6JB43_9EURO|nr:6-hydroxy-D-nicotine oxidase [Aspergillus minisclerotigenes]